MPVTREDWARYQAEMAAAAEHAAAPAREYARQAAVHADKLTGDSHWDHYLTRLQPLLDDAVKQVGLSMEAAVTAVDPQEIDRARLNHAFNKGLVAAFQTAIDLPQQLMSQGREPAKP